MQLSVAPSGARKWVLRYLWQGKPREMGLGSFPEVSLADAREKALAERRLTRLGVDPIAERKKAAEKSIPTFGECADDFVMAKQSEWRNDKHRAQWAMTLTKYAARLRKLPVDTIDTEAVLSVLKPVWQAKPETASRPRPD